MEPNCPAPTGQSYLPPLTSTSETCHLRTLPTTSTATYIRPPAYQPIYPNLAEAELERCDEPTNDAPWRPFNWPSFYRKSTK